MKLIASLALCVGCAFAPGAHALLTGDTATCTVTTSASFPITCNPTAVIGPGVEFTVNLAIPSIENFRWPSQIFFDFETETRTSGDLPPETYNLIAIFTPDPIAPPTSSTTPVIRLLAGEEFTVTFGSLNDPDGSIVEIDLHRSISGALPSADDSSSTSDSVSFQFDAPAVIGPDALTFFRLFVEPAAAVPEPNSTALVVTALIALMAISRRRKTDFRKLPPEPISMS